MEYDLQEKLSETLQMVMKSPKRSIVCEEQLQLDLAWELKKFFGNDAEIYLEYAVSGQGKRRYYDIVIESESELIPIELKFKTKAVEGYEYSNHAAQDLGRYDFWRDVERIESFGKKFGRKFKNGYAILVTNDTPYWNRSGEGRLYEQFSTKDQRTLSAGIVLKWRKGYNEQSVGKNRCQDITINGDYTLNWTDVTSPDGGAYFRALILEVK